MDRRILEHRRILEQWGFLEEIHDPRFSGLMEFLISCNQFAPEEQPRDYAKDLREELAETLGQEITFREALKAATEKGCSVSSVQSRASKQAFSRVREETYSSPEPLLSAPAVSV